MAGGEATGVEAIPLLLLVVKIGKELVLKLVLEIGQLGTSGPQLLSVEVDVAKTVDGTNSVDKSRVLEFRKIGVVPTDTGVVTEPMLGRDPMEELLLAVVETSGTRVVPGPSAEELGIAATDVDDSAGVVSGTSAV